MKIDQMPEYKGGVVKLYKYLTQKIVYPREAREKGIEGKVYVQFIITETGAIEDLSLIHI
mgnify:FL=1